ncbi:transposase family protein [Aerococcus suis]
MKDQNIEFSESKFEKCKFRGQNALFYYGKLVYEPSHCPICDSVKPDYNIVKNGTKISTITLPQISAMPTYLKIQKQRFYCKECQSYLTTQTPIVGENCFISKRLKNLIVKRSN